MSTPVESSGAASPQTEAPNASPTPAPARYTDSNWAEVITAAGTSDLAALQGATVRLSGQVFNLEEDATNVGIQIWVYPDQNQGNTVVVFRRDSGPEIAPGIRVQVEGTIDGILIRKTDQGQTLRLPRVAATKVAVIGEAPATASTAGAAQSLASPQGPAGTPTPNIFTVIDTPATGLNVRAGPSVSAARKGSIANGDLVRALGPPQAGWYQVQGENFTGYVSATYLRGPSALTAPKLATLH